MEGRRWSRWWRRPAGGRWEGFLANTVAAARAAAGLGPDGLAEELAVFEAAGVVSVWNLSRLLADPAARAVALGAFAEDWSRMNVVELDAATCESAAAIAETTGARGLDGMHLAAAVRVGGRPSTFLTFDGRQAGAARMLGLHVLGA